MKIPWVEQKKRMERAAPRLAESTRELLDLATWHCQSGNPPCDKVKAAMTRAHEALRAAGVPVVIEGREDPKIDVQQRARNKGARP